MNDANANIRNTPASINDWINLGLPVSLAVDTIKVPEGLEDSQGYIKSIERALLICALKANDLSFLEKLPEEKIPDDLKVAVLSLIEIQTKKNEICDKLIHLQELSLEIVKPFVFIEYVHIAERLNLRKQNQLQADNTILKKGDISTVIDLWQQGAVKALWANILNFIISKENDGSSFLSSSNDRDLTNAWLNPILRQSIKQHEDLRLDTVKKKLGLIARLKWAQEYKRGYHIEKDISKNFTYEDLTYDL